MRLQDIRAAVQQHGATWKVRESDLPEFGPEEMGRRLGFRRDDAELRRLRALPVPSIPRILAADAAARHAASGQQPVHDPAGPSAPSMLIDHFATAAAAPRSAAMDWRNHNGRNAVTPIRDQGNCGSCVAFGTTAMLESMVRLERSMTLDLSEADLFFCGGANCEDGWDPGSATSRIHSVGEPLEHCFPYQDHDMPCGSSADRSNEIVSVARVTSIYDVEQRKQYLDKVGPMVGCFEVYEDFYGYAGGVYRHVTGDDKGGHCVEIIGYDDNQRCWICKNSWGTNFGVNGFFNIGYGECGIDDDVEIFGIPIAGSPFWGVGGTQMAAGYGFRYFTGSFEAGGTDLLRYEPADEEWRLVHGSNGQLTFSDAGSTSGFGQIGDGRPFWTGDFRGLGRSQVLFYYPGDGNWFSGEYEAAQGHLAWNLEGNTLGRIAGQPNFGQVWDGRPFWTGDFRGLGRQQVLFYFPGDGNWWSGEHDPAQNHFVWNLEGNTLGRIAGQPNFGQVWDGRPFWVGNFRGLGRTEMLFYFPGDGNWWWGEHDPAQNHFVWSLAGNTLGHIAGQPNFGQVWDGRPFWIGDFSGAGHDQVLFYFPGDGNWWLGSYEAAQGHMVWTLAGNTLGKFVDQPNFGQIWDGRPFWTGDFARDGKTEVLFYFPGDGNWWMARYSVPEGRFLWDLAANTMLTPALA